MILKFIFKEIVYIFIGDVYKIYCKKCWEKFYK
jgi:hypothetical protein